MKSVRIVSVRKNTDPSIAKLESDYVKRLSGFAAVELTDVRAVYADSSPVPQVLAKESAEILKKIPERATVVALHETGKAFSSVELAAWFQKALGEASSGMVFVIGGPFGIDPAVLKRANLTLSLSRMTFTHEMARLILLEQLYRASQVVKGTGYHK